MSDEGSLIIVYGIVRTQEEDCIVHNEEGLFSYLDTLLPITLEVEHLIRYDFTYREIDSEVGYWSKDKFDIYENEEGLFSFDCLVGVDYLHHVQNLYFDFTGVELCV